MALCLNAAASQAGAVSESKGEAEMKQGETFLHQKNYARALEDLDKAISHDYKLKKVLLLRGDAKEHLNNFDGAIDDYTEYAQSAPADSDVLLRLSRLYQAQDKPNMALSYLSKALVMRPKDGTLYAKRAAIYEKLGQKENASVDREVARKLGVTQVTAIAGTKPNHTAEKRAAPSSRTSHSRRRGAVQ